MGGVAAASQTEGALETSGAASFDGELVLDIQTDVSMGDKFVIARYASHTGTFATVRVKGSAAANRRRATLAEDWQMEYGEQEATAEYMGSETVTAPPATQAPTPAPTPAPTTAAPTTEGPETTVVEATTVDDTSANVETTVVEVTTATAEEPSSEELLETSAAEVTTAEPETTTVAETSDEQTGEMEITSANALFMSIGAALLSTVVVLF